MPDSIACSVIVPVHDSGPGLRRVLEAVRDSDLEDGDWELIVIDDGSADESALLAAGYADTIIRLPAPPHGPAYARNRGSEVARGRILVFLDADVLVRPDSVRLLRERLEDDRTHDAVVAIFDAAPSQQEFVGRYRNLVLHVAQSSRAGEIGAFWAACGAIRRDVFRAVGMFNEWHFRGPQVEDVELGQRLTDGGFRIFRDREVQVSHARTWGAGTLLRNLWWRGVWIARMHLPGTEDDVGLVGTLVGLHRVRGGLDTLCLLPLHVLARGAYRLGWLSGWLLLHTLGEPRPDATTEAYSEVGVEKWPPVPVRR